MKRVSKSVESSSNSLDADGTEIKAGDFVTVAFGQNERIGGKVVLIGHQSIVFKTNKGEYLSYPPGEVIVHRYSGEMSEADAALLLSKTKGNRPLVDKQGVALRAGQVVVDTQTGEDGGIIETIGDAQVIYRSAAGRLDVVDPEDLVVLYDPAERPDKVRSGSIVIIDGPHVARVVRVLPDANAAVVDVLADAKTGKRFPKPDRVTWQLSDCDVVA